LAAVPDASHTAPYIARAAARNKQSENFLEIPARFKVIITPFSGLSYLLTGNLKPLS
jgi:hypothetical protein